MFAQYISTCIYVEPAAALCGISARTAYNWLDRGEAEYHRVEANPRASVTQAEHAYYYFFQTVTRARAQVEAKLAGEAILAAQAHHSRKDRDGNVYDFQGDGAQALSVLKCAFPDRWGQRKQSVDMDITSGGQVITYLPTNGRKKDTDDT